MLVSSIKYLKMGRASSSSSLVRGISRHLLPDTSIVKTCGRQVSI